MIFNNLFDLNFINCSSFIGGVAFLCVSGYFLKNYLFKIDSSLLADNNKPTINNLTDANIQTINNLTDAEVQTPLNLLDKLIGDLILNSYPTDESSRLTYDFLGRYKNNPEFADFFRDSRIGDWLEEMEMNNSDEAVSSPIFSER